DSKALTFLYENTSLPWAMTGKTDENNTRLATFTYDSSGRATSTEYAAGAQNYTIAYSGVWKLIPVDTYDSVKDVWIRTLDWEPPGPITISDPSGTASALDTQMANGMPLITASSQAAGSGSTETSTARTYDSVGNILSYDDATGSRTCYVYQNNLEIVRVEGLATTVDCSTVTPSGATLPTGARKVTTTWHPDWKMPVVVTEPLKKTTIVYHGQPDPFNSNATASCSTAATRADGKAAPVVCKRVEQALQPEVTGGSTPTDDSYANVTLLLHGNGTNGSTTITDNGPGNRTVSVFGNAKVSTTQSKFGGAALAYDGAGDYMQVANSSAFGITLGDFTLEAWVYIAGDAPTNGSGNRDMTLMN